MLNNEQRSETSDRIVSKVIQFSMDVIGIKKAMDKKIADNSYNKEPAELPASILRKLKVEVSEITERKVWTLSPKNTSPTTVVLFLHGGAYYANITHMHWRFIEQLVNSTQATFIVPDYPLAPESVCTDTFQFIDKVYAQLLARFSSNQIVLMGDSAGGGIALGFAQKICNENIQQAQRIILFSPWLDVSMTNPDISIYDQRDKILNVEGLKMAGQNYAGELGVNDYRVSPIHGDLTRLGSITLFIGTNDLLLADARKLKQLMDNQQLSLEYYEFPEMFHDWVIVPGLKETKLVVQRVAELIINA